MSQVLTAAQKMAEGRRDTPQNLRLRTPPAAVTVAVKLCEPRPGAIETAAVLATPDRSWALAFRLERHDNRWLATMMHLL